MEAESSELINADGNNKSSTADLSNSEEIQFENGVPIFHLGLEDIDFGNASDDEDYFPLLRRRHLLTRSVRESNKENDER